MGAACAGIDVLISVTGTPRRVASLPLGHSDEDKTCPVPNPAPLRGGGDRKLHFICMHLRHATIDDLELLQLWDEQPHVIESDPNDDWGWATELKRDVPWREQLIAETDGRPVAFVQIIDPLLEDSHYWGADVAPNLRAIDIWIGDANDLSKGYGSQIMRLAIARCFADPSVTSILIDPLASNLRAHRFYERFGFEFIERRYFGRDDCFVYRLERSKWAGNRTLQT